MSNLICAQSDLVIMELGDLMEIYRSIVKSEQFDKIKCNDFDEGCDPTEDFLREPNEGDLMCMLSVWLHLEVDHEEGGPWRFRIMNGDSWDGHIEAFCLLAQHLGVIMEPGWLVTTMDNSYQTWAVLWLPNLGGGAPRVIKMELDGLLETLTSSQGLLELGLVEG